MGEYYLDREKYADGLAAFRETVADHPDDPVAHYYLGRFCLAEERPEEALDHLRTAVDLDPGSADYRFWSGVCHSTLGRPEDERRAYEEALERKPDHVPALVYSGHNRLDAGDCQGALAHYAEALRLAPESPQALFNRALALECLHRDAEAAAAWKAYLDRYPTGAFGRQAADRLNRLGDFTYRNARIGRRSVTLKQVEFQPLEPALADGSRSTLDFVGHLIASDPHLVLQVLVFQKNDPFLSKERARSIKAYLLAHHDAIGEDRIRLSWFDVPETVTLDGRRFRQDQSVRFFTTK
jgi:tetratricopeptide (TPR) repeat protein